MNRFFLCSLFLFSLMVGITVAAHPARPLYEPPDPPKPLAPVVVNLAGSAWLGKYAAANRTYIFEADGTLSYKTATVTIFKNRGAWRLEGNTIYFEHHIGIKAKKTLEFRGVLKDPNTIVGEQTMVVTGAKTNVTMQRTMVGVK
ncbi:MAG: hypothetical protein EXR98_02525 [Gemmataceae bacterium]|nr:hypothetical protein [Gemmataceae bacterium]